MQTSLRAEDGSEGRLALGRRWGQIKRPQSGGRGYDLVSTAAGGRWGPEGAFGVLYLGRPLPSVVVEAYRHLVDDDLDGMPPSAVGPRRLVTCEVNVERILDLRDPDVFDGLSLDAESLRSDVGAYGPCHRVALAAHQLELWGIIAPAATGLGETLALFETHVPPDRWPRLTSSEMWSQLPADRRRLRLNRDASPGRLDQAATHRIGKPCQVRQRPPRDAGRGR